ncbi:class I SAM-dependent methyltransferase [Magnetospirillum moscoviense]|nr:class I SAM-dependent methyltransferase [Magnetospirillum moscoviense]
MSQDLFKGNATKIEMSRYIDLDIYHAVERTHPFYVEMTDAIHDVLVRLGLERRQARAWEFGAGTGLATEELLRYPNLSVDAVDLDQECCRILEDHMQAKGGHHVRVFCDDALTHGEVGAYDLALSVFAHDHIPSSLAGALVRNIRKNLKAGGHYVMGGEFLPHYETEDQWRRALYTYHGFIVDHALRNEHFEVAQIEISALRSGLYRIGDFKRHEALFEAEMLADGFRLDSKIKIGPLESDDVGGVFVYVFEAI